MNVKIKMQYERSTKGTHVFKEAGEDFFIGTLYIRKNKIPGDPPQEIEVTVLGVHQTSGKKNKK